MKGLIVKALSGFYYVKTDNGVIECKARGKFRNDKTTPFVGDWVEISLSGEKGTVDRIYDRKNLLIRPPVANIDKLFIISSSVTPTPNTLLIDRMTAICAYKDIEPVIVFNKNDLEDVTPWCDIYLNSGFKTVSCSAANGEGIEQIKKELENAITAFTGNSGAGKSSLLNIIFPELSLSTGVVSDKLGRGRHTTRHTELFEHKFGGFVADTPGFSSLETDKEDLEFKDGLADFFPEFDEFKYDCRFADCAHIGEKGCAVCSAVEAGKIQKSRYDSYLAIYNELKDVKAWNIKK